MKESDAVCHHLGYDRAVSNYASVITKPDPTVKVHNLDLACEKGDAYHEARCWTSAPGCRISQPLKVTCSEDHASEYSIV